MILHMVDAGLLSRMVFLDLAFMFSYQGKECHTS